MKEELKQKIQILLNQLPKQVEGVINSFDWEQKIIEIGKEQLLDNNEINILINEIALVLIMEKDKTLLSLNIENNIGISKNEAKKITEKIDQKIFNPLTQKIESSVKNQITVNPPTWDQTVNFIISGGDYSAFLDNK